MSAYRAIPPAEIDCPRCKKRLPPQDVASDKCGTWISAFAATEVLTDEERRHDPVTRWWRVRAPCPICGEQMLLRGDEPCLLQGCDGHGFWIDADTIEHTQKLWRGVDHAALEAKRNDEARLAADQQERLDAERKRAAERELRASSASRTDAARAKLGWNDDEARPPESDERTVAPSTNPPSTKPSSSHEALLVRIEELERRNDELEDRVAALEAQIVTTRR